MNATAASPLVEVSAGILIREDGAVLLARRPPSKVYAGYWEFPGGKVEPGETAHEALVRELDEELGIQVISAYRWIIQEFTYPHAAVRLNFFRVTGWRGQVQAKEHDGMSWNAPHDIRVAPLLPANGPVLRGLVLPAEYAITQCINLGMDAQLNRIRNRLDAGLKLIQVREPGMAIPHLEAFSRSVIALAHPAGARVLLNSDIELARRCGADGVHLTARQLAATKTRPDLPVVGVSCHDAAELQAAGRLGADFAVLGSVLPTASHPGVTPLGWAQFAQIAGLAVLPVFALGGITPADMETAWKHGAHGIAMLRGAWQ